MRTEAKGRALLDLNAHAALPLPLARCRQHQLPAPAAHVHEGGRLCRLDLRHERQEEAQIHLPVGEFSFHSLALLPGFFIRRCFLLLQHIVDVVVVLHVFALRHHACANQGSFVVHRVIQVFQPGLYFFGFFYHLLRDDIPRNQLAVTS